MSCTCHCYKVANTNINANPCVRRRMLMRFGLGLIGLALEDSLKSSCHVLAASVIFKWHISSSPYAMEISMQTSIKDDKCVNILPGVQHNISCGRAGYFSCSSQFARFDSQ